MVNAVNSPFAKEYYLKSSQEVCSFHALPINKGKSITGSKWDSIYNELFNNGFRSESSISSPFLDCLISPQESILEAEKLAAKTYGSDATLFTTCGTSIANEIVVRAVIEARQTRVLADRGLHQSIHFSLDDRYARVDYLNLVEANAVTQLYALDLDELTEKLKAAEKEGDPYQCVVINGQAYEGLVYDAGALVRAIEKSGPSVKTVFIDEAWGAASYFHPDLKTKVAMRANEHGKSSVTVISTQSAHKSISAFRQGSFIHIKGDTSVVERLRNARYRWHTTSPNLAIVASLDLARNQMDEDGENLLRRAQKMARSLRDQVDNDPKLEKYEICDTSLPDFMKNYIMQDDTKVFVCADGVGLSGQELRRRLFEDHGIYTSRCGETSVLFNIHIGITRVDIDLLVRALKTISLEVDAFEVEQERSGRFIIPYPPGVPIAVPSDVIDPVIISRIRNAERCGATLMSITNRSS